MNGINNMKKLTDKKKQKNSYTNFIMNGGQIFPEDMYFTRKFRIKKIKYPPYERIIKTM